MAPRPPAPRGFTLLEAMVAVAVLAIGLVGAAEVVGGALRNHVRAQRLEVATLLARGKLAEVTARFEDDGFRDFDQAEDGTFEDEGHPEVRWAVTAVKPTVDLGAEGVVKALTGLDGGVAGLFGLEGDTPGQGPATSSPLAGPALSLLQQQLATLGEEIKRSVREVRLTVSWEDAGATEAFTVTTHLVVVQPRGQAAAPQAPAGPAPRLPGAPTTPPAAPGNAP